MYVRGWKCSNKCGFVASTKPADGRCPKCGSFVWLQSPSLPWGPLQGLEGGVFPRGNGYDMVSRKDRENDWSHIDGGWGH
jgi:hypothetical protein